MRTTPIEQIEPRLITSDEDLAICCDLLKTRKWLALDTEFIREKTYRPQLCLLQIKSGDHLVIVDTLSINDLSPLSDLLHDPGITKILHAATQDLEIFYWLDRKIPTPLFDTQIAAPLLGFDEQIGYGNLVREMLGIELSKAHTRTDWSRRPLSTQQIQYAADDVIYLEAVYLRQLDELEKSNRLSWLEPEFEILADHSRYQKPAKEMWKKIRSAQKLKGASLSALQALAEWRELRARESNLPRNWLLKDDLLTELARQLPSNIHEMEQIRGISSQFKKRHGEDLIDLIQRARKLEPEPLPSWSRKQKITQEQKTITEFLNAFVSLRANQLNIHPSLLGPRKMLETCAVSGNSTHLSGWRSKLIGADIQSLLDGDSVLRMQAGELSFIRVHDN